MPEQNVDRATEAKQSGDFIKPYVDALSTKLKWAAVLSLVLSVALSIKQPEWALVGNALSETALAVWSAVVWVAKGAAALTALAGHLLWNTPAYGLALPLSLLGLYLHVQYWEKARWCQGIGRLVLKRDSVPVKVKRAAQLSGFLQWILTPLAMASTVYFCDARPLYATAFNVIALLPGLALMRSMSTMNSQVHPLHEDTSGVSVYILALVAGAGAGMAHGFTGLVAGAAGMLVLCRLAKLPPCPVFQAQGEDIEASEGPKVWND